MAAACRFGLLHGDHNLALTGMQRNLSSIGSLGGLMWKSSTTGVVKRGGIVTTTTTSQVRSYGSNSRDGVSSSSSSSSVTQKGKYTRGLNVKKEELPSRSRVTGQSLRGQSETLTKYYATCAPGLEKVLAAELSSPLISAQEVEEGSAGVSFVGTKVTGYKANLWLRTAVRVLVQLAAGPLPLGRGRYDPVYTFIRDAVDWPSILVDASSGEGVVPQSFKFRNFVVQSRVWSCTDISSSEFATLRAKDAICDAVREACGGNRPEPPEKGTVVDVPLFLSLYRDTAVLYRDLSGVSLHKRGYRDVMHRASLNEGIAAACLTIAGWNQALAGFGDANKNASQKERVLLDPMCGSGTFLIEAALMASNFAPGLLRRQWPFQVSNREPTTHAPDHICCEMNALQ
jgi:23S rRNA G2445 N2-methylase RlmL